MTNQTPPNSRPPRDERQDELIAVLVALGAIGTIFFWGFNRIGNDAKLVAQSDGNPIAAVDERDGFFAGADDTSDDEGISGVLGTADDEEKGDRPVNEDSAADTRQANSSGLGPVGAAVGGGVLMNSVGDADAAEPDAEPEKVVEKEEPAPEVEEANPDDGEVELSDLATDVPVEGFSDIDDGYWASPFIEGLRENEIATGFVGGKFSPDTPVSRSQFAAQLYRAGQKYDQFAQEKASTALSYSDIPSTHPQVEAIGHATKTGFMNGYPEGDFRPNDKVSKLEVLVALTSGLNLDVPSNPQEFLGDYYGDVSDIPDWAIDQIAAATNAGLVVNYNDLQSLKPKRPATRAEASAMLYQALTSVGEAPEVESEYIIAP